MIRNRLKIFEIIIAFLIDNKDEKSCFLKKIFLFADIAIDITFEIFFLVWSNIKINFIN